MALFGTMGGLQNVLSGYMPGAEEKVPGQGRRRGLFGRLGNALGDFDPTRLLLAQALIQGDHATAAQIMAAQRSARGRQDAAQEARDLEARRAEALEASGFTKNQISAMQPDDISQLLRERLQPRQFGAEGGSIYNPSTGTYDRAPSRSQVGRSIVDFEANSTAPRTIYEGVEPVSVQPGGQVYGVTGTGRVVGPEGLGSAPPAPPQAPTGASNEQQLREQAAEAIRQGADPAAVAQRLQQMLRGGAGPSGPRNFR